MPMITFVCKKCKHEEKKLFKTKDLKSVKDKGDCPVCGEKESFVRLLGGAASVSKMRIDNGSMPKAVETYRDIQEWKESLNPTFEPKADTQENDAD